MLIAHAQTTASAAPAITVAATLSPAQRAAIEQQLQVAEATLINLEMQNGIPTPADAGTPSTIPASIAGTGLQNAPLATAPAMTGLSVSEINSFQATLGALSATLSQLNNAVAGNTLTSSQTASVAATLPGMQGTLAAMATDVTTGGSSAPASAPIAAAKPSAPSTPVAVNTAPAAQTSAATTSAPATATPVVAAQTQSSPSVNNAAPQTAQASSLWSFTKAHWPTIVIVLLVIAILAILFWPEKKELVRTVSTASSGSGKPKSAPILSAAAPATTVNFSHDVTASASPSNPKPVASNAAHMQTAPATPVASAVAAPSQK